MQRPVRRWAIMAIILALAGRAGGQGVAPTSAMPTGRGVSVRIFMGDTYDPAARPSPFGARTYSVAEDQRFMGDVNRVGSEACDVAEKEVKVDGYAPSSLVKAGETGLGPYLTANVPTLICYCSGHVLVMAGGNQARQGNSLKSGPFPPVAVGGSALYETATLWGTLLKGTPDEGDIVFYWKRENIATKPAEPDHVAYVRADGQVISKDDRKRVYILPIGVANTVSAAVTSGDVSSALYGKKEVWHIRWSNLSAQLVAGPIEARNLDVGTDELWAGGEATLRFDYTVRNAPAGKLEVKAEATLYNGSGDPVGNGQLQTLSPTRTAPRTLTGAGSFRFRLGEPGQYTCNLIVSGRQVASLDEVDATYEPCIIQKKFEVKARAAIAEVRVGVTPTRLRANAPLTVTAQYRLTGLPTAVVSGAKPPRYQVCVQSLSSSKPATFKEYSAIDPSGVIVHEATKTVAATLPVGKHRLRITVRLVDLPGVLAADKVQECEYEITE